MDEIEKKLRREEASLKLTQREREKMTVAGCYPKKFHFPLSI